MLLADDDINDVTDVINANDADDVDDTNNAKANDNRSRKKKGYVSTLVSIESSDS
jgi:hypothetical protein